MNLHDYLTILGFMGGLIWWFYRLLNAIQKQIDSKTSCEEFNKFKDKIQDNLLNVATRSDVKELENRITSNLNNQLTSMNNLLTELVKNSMKK